MIESIYGTYAAHYYAAGLPVIPLQPREKRPIVLGWSEYCTKMPEEALRESWISTYPDANIGLALGPCSKLVAIDIDTDRGDVLAVLEAMLPPSPWTRVGKKGNVRLYRWNGHRACKIKADTGEMLVELLSTGNQVVMPPSIHPDTGKAYTANCDLVDVLGQIPELPKDFEDQLRTRLRVEGIALSIAGLASLVSWVSQGDRDNAIVRNAGMLARQVLAGKLALADALDDIQTFVKDRVENVCGDPMSPDKAVEKVVEFIRKDVLAREKILPVGWDRRLTDEQRDAFGLNFDKNQQAWTGQEIQDYLRDEVIGRVPANVLHQELRAALARVAANPELRAHELERATLFRWIAQSVGNGVTIAGLNKEYLTQLRGDVEGLNHSEIARAVLADMQEEVEDGEVRFHHDRFWDWSGSCWRDIGEGEIRKRIAENYGHLAAAKRWSDVRGILQVMQDLARKDLIDVPTVGINFANGFLTEDLRLQPHDRAFGATYTLDFCYDPDKVEGSKRWLDLLQTAWGQDYDFADKVAALREAMCVTMFGKATDLQRAVLLLGPGGTGKSQILEIMRSLMPEGTTSNVPPTDWANDRFATASMAGKLLNVCGELSESQMIDGRMFKGIISGDPQEAQFKGRDRFEYKPKAANWFASNYIPKTRDTSSGFNRRWLILTFTHPVPLDKRILNIAEQIVSEEREAIVAWAVAALPSLMARREYTLPSSHVERVRDLASQNNSVHFFIVQSGRVALSAGSRISADELFSEFEAFSRREGFARAAGRPRFMMAMRELEHELGFRMVREEASAVTGLDKYWFDGVTLAS